MDWTALIAAILLWLAPLAPTPLPAQPAQPFINSTPPVVVVQPHCPKVIDPMNWPKDCPA